MATRGRIESISMENCRHMVSQRITPLNRHSKLILSIKSIITSTFLLSTYTHFVYRPRGSISLINRRVWTQEAIARNWEILSFLPNSEVYPGVRHLVTLLFLYQTFWHFFPTLFVKFTKPLVKSLKKFGVSGRTLRVTRQFSNFYTNFFLSVLRAQKSCVYPWIKLFNYAALSFRAKKFV